MPKNFAAIMVIALLVTGCSAQTSTITPSSSPSPSPSPSPFPSVSATPTSTPDYSNPIDWVIGYGTVGPLTVGGTLSSAERDLAGVTVSRQDPCSWFVILSTADIELWVMTSQADDDLIEEIVVGDGGAPQQSAPQLRTAAGVSVGASLSDVLAAYPDVVEHQAKYARVFSTTDGSGSFINFSVNADDVVVAIVTSSTDHTRDEYCG